MKSMLYSGVERAPSPEGKCYFIFKVYIFIFNMISSVIDVYFLYIITSRHAWHCQSRVVWAFEWKNKTKMGRKLGLT